MVNTGVGFVLYRHEKPAAYLLILGALGIQTIIWAAALSTMG
jgi:hypothetical protein